MTLINWLGLALTAVILAVSIALHFYYRRKFSKLDGFGGIVNERGETPRRADFNWEKAEAIRLEKEAKASENDARHL